MENYKELKYKTKLTSRRNSIAVVFLNDIIEIRAPKNTSQKVINKFLENNYELIINKLDNSKTFIRSYSQNEEFLIQGEVYTFNIIKSHKNELEIVNNTINLYVIEDRKEEKQKLIENYLRKIAQIDVKRLVLKHSNIMDLYPTNVKINKADKRWGSCNYVSKTLNFSLKIAMLPDMVQEYIIIHELAHLEHPNHSKHFWQFVEKFMPDYKQAEKYIKANQSMLSL